MSVYSCNYPQPATGTGGGTFALLPIPFDPKTGAGGGAGDLNNTGSVIGATGASTGALWTGGSYTSLGTFLPVAINDAGTIAGYRLANGVGTPYVRAPDGTVTKVADAGAASQPGNYPTGINNAGDITGYLFPAHGGPEAWVRHQGKVHYVDDLLPTGATGWDIISTTGISEQGEIIGEADHNGARVGYLLTPQYPGFKLHGAVRSADGAQPLPDVALQISGPRSFTVTTNAAGEYSAHLEPGTYTITPAADDIVPTTGPPACAPAGRGCSVTITDADVRVDFRLDVVELRGTVTSGLAGGRTFAPVAGIPVQWSGPTSGATVTGPDGRWSALVKRGTYIVTAPKGFCSLPASWPCEAQTRVAAPNIVDFRRLLYRVTGRVFREVCLLDKDRCTITPNAKVGILARGTGGLAEGRSAITNAGGHYTLDLLPGSYRIEPARLKTTPPRRHALTLGGLVTRAKGVDFRTCARRSLVNQCRIAIDVTVRDLSGARLPHAYVRASDSRSRDYLGIVGNTGRNARDIDFGLGDGTWYVSFEGYEVSDALDMKSLNPPLPFFEPAISFLRLRDVRHAFTACPGRVGKFVQPGGLPACRFDVRAEDDVPQKTDVGIRVGVVRITGRIRNSPSPTVAIVARSDAGREVAVAHMPTSDDTGRYELFVPVQLARSLKVVAVAGSAGNETLGTITRCRAGKIGGPANSECALKMGRERASATVDVTFGQG